ncbi:hypothetical protein [Microbacterium sp. LMI1x-1-1.1]|uniref:hypothetical protein n=1 Tax=Microbacterium sp. LMI1x-1-1.1 TaxID=3135246 RepID=UPI003440890E
MAEIYTPLATREDVVAALGRALTPSEEMSLEVRLVTASGLFRAEARRQFTAGRKTVRLKVNGGEVRLPETPVHDIHSVTSADGPIAYTQTGNILSLGLRSVAFVTVDYSFGSADIPAEVTATVAAMVARVYGVDVRAAAGFTQVSSSEGPYSESGQFAGWAVGGQVMLAPADAAVARQYRPARLPTTIVSGS